MTIDEQLRQHTTNQILFELVEINKETINLGSSYLVEALTKENEILEKAMEEIAKAWQD